MRDFSTILADAFETGICLLLVLSEPRNGTADRIEKLSVRPVVVRGNDRYQLATKINGCETHENLTATETIERVSRLFGTHFSNCHLFTTEADYSIRVNREESFRIKQHPPTKQRQPAGHDRPKKYLLPVNEPCPFLIEIGVMTAGGKVRAAKQQKFRQINRFLELVDDVLDALPSQRRLNVVDFGCGKSYLTFALFHLLTNIRRRAVRIVGLDRNTDVIRHCRDIAERLGWSDLQFQVGNIAEHQADEKVDLAVSLHACDTATDDALAKAVGWQADVILAVPCCQHELASTLNNTHLSPLLQHGILKERLAALVTDALRARVLELCGYSTQVVEFIDLEHTAKNLLIRAVRREADPPNQAEKLESYREFKELLGLKQWYLEEALPRSIG